MKPLDPQILLLLTTICGFAWQAWREQRNRRWATEDRAAQAQAIISTARAEAEATRIKTESVAETLRLEGVHIAENLRLSNLLAAAQAREETRIAAENVRLEQDARARSIREHSSAEGVRVRAQQDAHNALVVAKIAESTAASKAAEVEANHANLKIENLNQRLLDSQTLSTTAATEARTVGDDTLAHVHTLVTKVDEQASVGQATHALVEHIDAKVSVPKK